MLTSSDLDIETQERRPKTLILLSPPLIVLPDWYQRIAQRAGRRLEARRAIGLRKKQARALVEKALHSGMSKDGGQEGYDGTVEV